MDNFTLVRPEHPNHHGYLFGDGRKEPLPATPPLRSLAGSPRL